MAALTAIPTQHLSAFRDFTKHLESTQETYIDGQLGEPTYTPTADLRDTGFLIKAVCLRSQPTNGLSNAIATGRFKLRDALSGKVRGLVRAMAATEAIRTTITKSPESRPELESAQRELELAVREFPECYYAHAALTECALAPIKQRLQQGIDPTDADRKLVDAKLAELDVWVPRFLQFVGPLKLTVSSFNGRLPTETKNCDAWSTVALLVTYNNWLDLQCLLAARRPEHSAQSPAHLDLDDNAIADNVSQLVAQAAAFRIPRVLSLSLQVTELEYMYLRITDGGRTTWDVPSSQFSAKLTPLLHALLEGPRLLGTGELDGRDSAVLRTYLRGGSPFIRWPEQAFDSYLRLARERRR